MYKSRDGTLLTDNARCLPNRPLWEPLGIDGLDDRELDDFIADVKASLAATESELVDR